MLLSGPFCCALYPREQGSGSEKRNSDPLAGTQYLFSAPLAVGVHVAKACQTIGVGWRMASLIGRATLHSTDELSMFRN